MQNLTIGQVALILSLGLLNSAVIGFFDKGQLKESITAVFRSLFQLIVLGLLLDKVFAMETSIAKLIALFFICIMGGYTLNKRLQGDSRQLVILVNILLLSTVPGILFGYILLRDDYFGAPSFFIPFCGMLIGNSINGLHLGISNFHKSIKESKTQIELKLLLGANGHYAFRDNIKLAMKNGLVPIINAMLIVGIVSIPGLMTGQLLAGVSPLISARYQFFIMIAIQSTVIGGLVSYFFLQLFLIKDNQYVLELLDQRNV